jgi:hypothetical protein
MVLLLDRFDVRIAPLFTEFPVFIAAAVTAELIVLVSNGRGRTFQLAEDNPCIPTPITGKVNHHD